MFPRALPCPTCGCGIPCSTDCLILPGGQSDSFASDTSGNYDTISGSGSITGGKFTTTSSDAIFLHKCELDIGKGRAYAIVTSDNAGAKGRVYGAWTDGDNHLYAELSFATSGTATLSLWKKTTAGGLVQLSTTTPVASVGAQFLTLCWDGVEVHAGLNNGISDDAEVSANETLTGTRGGFGGDADGGTLSFDQFTLQRNIADTNGCIDCRRCAACNAGTVPEQIQVDIADLNNKPHASCVDCTTLNTTYILDSLAASAPGGVAPNGSSCGWAADISNGDCLGIVKIVVIMVLVSPTVTSVGIEFRDSGGTAQITANKNVTRPRNCNGTLTSFTAGVSGFCDASSITVTIDPL